MASLNHSNIATLHGLDECDGQLYLVMELVPGETLAERLKRGPLAVDEALAVARQVADALEAAHENGVIHRDVKPANIKITPEGVVKVLDFGLAKAFAPDGTNENPSSSPTLSAAGTRAGVILGTASYMSPEQARGQTVDKRSDIFSFGSVLYEMLTGRLPFRGDTVSDILASILKSEPDWTELPFAIDPRLDELVRGCLKKDPKERRRDIGDVRNTIRDVQADQRQPAVIERSVKLIRWRRTLAWVVSASFVAAALTWNLKPPPAQPVTRLSVVLPPSNALTWSWRHSVALSPDGKLLVYAANNQLYLRAMDQTEVAPIRGAENGMEPFFSPDGRWLGFYSPGVLKKVPLAGGAVVTLCEVDFPHGASWSSDDTIVFGLGERGIFRVSADGGAPEVLIEMDSTKGEMAHGPELLPDGETLLFTLRSGGSWDEAQIVAQSLSTGERRVLVNTGTDGRYVPTGHLVYSHARTLLAVPFDLGTLEVTGGAMPIVEEILQAPIEAAGAAQFAFSRSGSLVWAPPSTALNRLAWVNRRGTVELLPLRATDRAAVYPRLSPDGQQIAFIDGTDLWVYDVRRGASARLTFTGNNAKPEWSPDGKRVVFSSGVGGVSNVFWIEADGSDAAVQLTESELEQHPESVSPDGTVLAYREQHPETNYDIWILALQGEGEPRVFAQTSFNERGAVFSPDGRFLAYMSDESGRDEIYMQPFPGPGGKVPVSTEGGVAPAWSPTGRELFYQSGDRMMSVTVTNGTVGTPKFLFEKPGTRSARIADVANYDVTADGERFLMVVSGGTSMQLHVVLNWFDELERLVPSDR